MVLPVVAVDLWKNLKFNDENWLKTTFPNLQDPVYTNMMQSCTIMCNTRSDRMTHNSDLTYSPLLGYVMQFQVLPAKVNREHHLLTGFACSYTLQLWENNIASAQELLYKIEVHTVLTIGKITYRQ